MAVKLVEDPTRQDADTTAWAILLDACEQALIIEGLSESRRGRLLRCRAALARQLGDRHLDTAGGRD